jgi:E3 ubiquitin-protein ligase UBR1
MLSTFVGLSTQYHALGSHIKYEADYARGFTLLSDISHVGKELGNCFLRFPTPGSVATAAPFDQIRQVMRRICADTQLETEVLDKRKYALPVTHIQKGVLLPHSEVTTYNLQVWGIKAFSFHHYLHYLLGELTKTLFTLPHHNSDSLRTLFKRHVFDHKKLDQDVQMLLIIDQTLTSESLVPL